MNNKVSISLNSPNRATKQLKIKNLSGKRKVVISTNWLNLFDFQSGDAVVERSLGKGKGFVVERVYDLFDAPIRTKRVYERSYNKRRNNPAESLLETSSKRLLDESIPEDCESVHVTFTKGKVYVAPIKTLQARAIRNAKNAKDKLSAFAACTSGVDLFAMQKEGFSIHSVLEYRPQERRDKSDLTETGAMNVLQNIPNICNFYNEDIYSIDVNRIAKDIENNPYTIFHASPQCDDLSNVKGEKFKQAHLDDTTSTMDMVIDMLDIIRATAPPCIVLENVSGFVKSEAYKIASLRLKRYGYKESVFVGDARDFGGITSRKRAYCIFSVLPVELKLPTPSPRRSTPIWDIVEPYIKHCRDVTHSKSLQDGITTGRLRVITTESLHSPTFLKSQSRSAKDSCVIQTSDNRLLWPTEELMKRLMGISEDFDLSAVGGVIGSEIIGQSIDVPLHMALMNSLKEHIQAYFSGEANCLPFSA